MADETPALPPIREVIARHGLSASKALGQNFLLDEQLLGRIAAIPGDLEGARVLATGDGANDIPMIEAADYGIAYRAKPKARDAANGRIVSEDLTAILSLFAIPKSEWVEG